MDFKILVTQAEKDYELIDSGEGEKLERYGEIILARPDPQALWKKSLSKKEWDAAHAHFLREGEKGEWKVKKDVPDKWTIDFTGLTFGIKLSAFKHTGIFPEQKSNWEWIQKVIKSQKEIAKPKILNLFAYTGGATLAAAKAGAEVVHVDGSKVAMTAARENAELSGLKDKPIRWILDDVLTFVKREVKRGNTYDGIIMDPPAFGRGPEGEIWKIEDHSWNFSNCARNSFQISLFSF
jgi:23S rRNA (cytosine1962-C5)-methyltransferase